MKYVTFQNIIKRATGKNVTKRNSKKYDEFFDYYSETYDLLIDNVYQKRFIMDGKENEIYAISTSFDIDEDSRVKLLKEDLVEIREYNLWKYLEHETARLWSLDDDILTKRNKGMIDESIYSEILESNLMVDMLSCKLKYTQNFFVKQFEVMRVNIDQLQR